MSNNKMVVEEETAEILAEDATNAKALKKQKKKNKKKMGKEEPKEEEEQVIVTSEKKKKKKKDKKKRKADALNEEGSSSASSPKEEQELVLKKVKKHKKGEEASEDGKEDNNSYREKHDITVEGEKVPKPYATFEKARKGFANVAWPCLDRCCKTFEKPSPIQAQAWPIILRGNDMVGIAETGSGKTLAFLLPGICRLLEGKFGKGGPAKPRILVIAPTRELAMQSQKVAEVACEACEDLSSVVVFGGQPKWEQKKLIQECSTLDILVATPGRLLDFVNGNEIDLSCVHYMVLDEADRMLDMGFEKDVKRIMALTVPVEKGRQTVMFSATWPQEIRELAHSFMNNPMKVVIGKDKLTASKSVRQNVEVVDPKAKEKKLLNLLQKLHNGKNRIIVFALYKKEAARLESLLERNRYKVVGVHGDKSQNLREEAVRKFQTGEFPILVATDVASRGLDIKGVEYVINVSFPLTIEDYVHRIGRTGRAGATGKAYTFFTFHDKHLAGSLQNILREAGEKVPEELSKFGNTVKKKEHKLYGSHFKASEDMPDKKASHITFDSDEEA